MMQTYFDLSTRARRALAATALGVMTAAIAVAPASAAPGCDGLASNDLEYEEELNCAAGESSGEYTITLTDSFSVIDFAFNIYDGTVPLAVQGANADVVITGPGAGTPIDIPGYEGLIGSFLAITGGGTSPVTVRDLTLEDFSLVGTILNDSQRPLTVSDTTISNGGAGREVDLGLERGGAVLSSGDLTVIDSHFEENDTWVGGAVSTYSTGITDVDSRPSLTVTDSTFTGNTAMSAGAVMAYGDGTITGSTFTDNVGIDGGAVSSLGSTLTIEDSTFDGNQADGNFDGISQPGATGGAVTAQRELTITGSTFADNSSDGFGGAISASDLIAGGEGDYLIEDTVFERNTAAFGGAALDLAGVAALTDVTIRDHDGASAIESYGPLAATGLTVTGNSAPSGSAVVNIAADGTDVTLSNSTIVNNTTADARATFAVSDADAVSVTHSTFADNANTGGAAADLAVEDSSSAALTGSAWATASAVPSCLIDSPATTAWNFDIDGSCTADWSGEGDFGDGLDAQLTALADNGGATQTLLPGDDSPLVDVIPAAALAVDTDQRGVTRPQGDAGDIGAVEVEREPTEPGTDPEPGDEAGLVRFEVKTDAGTITGTASPALAVDGIDWIPTGDLETAPPADTMFPYGAAAFTVEVPQAGDSVTITLTAPRPFTTLLKSGDDAWSEVDGATFSNNGTTVTYTLTDGGDLDEDGEANGYIVDPVALAVQGTFTG